MKGPVSSLYDKLWWDQYKVRFAKRQRCLYFGKSLLMSLFTFCFIWIHIVLTDKQKVDFNGSKSLTVNFLAYFVLSSDGNISQQKNELLNFCMAEVLMNLCDLC